MAKKEFGLGNMADDLVSLTLELCGKADDRNPRFPRLFYPSFVTRTINTALDIQELMEKQNGAYVSRRTGGKHVKNNR